MIIQVKIITDNGVEILHREFPEFGGVLLLSKESEEKSYNTADTIVGYRIEPIFYEE